MEVRLPKPLPKDYRAFLLETNGGTLESNRFPIASGDSSCLNYFYGIGTKKRVLSFSEVFEYFGDLCKRGFLPIAPDPFGNQVVISLRRRDHGKVYFWDHELGFGSDSRTLLSNSFDEFTDSIEAVVEEDPYLKPEFVDIVARDDTEALSTLLDSGVDPDLRIKRGATLLGYSIRSESVGSMNLLVERGANVENALITAISSEKDEMGVIIVRNGWGCGPETWGEVDWLHRAADRDLPKTVTALLDAGYPVNNFDSHGRSALAACMYKPESEVYKIILNRGGVECYRNS